MKRMLTAFLALALMAQIARADLKQYIDNSTIFAGEADVTKADPAVLELWMRQAMTACGLIGKSPTALKPEEIDSFMGTLKRGIADFTASGGKQIYIVSQMELIKDGGIAVIVPAAPGGDAKKLAALLYSGNVNGPTSMPAAQMRGMPQKFFPRAGVVGNNVAVWGRGGSVDYVKNLQPADRPDIAAGLTALGDSPIKFVIAPPLPVRMMAKGFWPEKIFNEPSTALTNDVLYVAAGATLPASPTVKVIVQSATPASAQSALNIVTGGLASISGVPPTISPDLAKLLTPELKNDQLVLTANSDKLMAIAKELALPMAAARQQAVQSLTMSNMRQILMCCQMYANENKGKYPDDLKGIEKYLRGNVKQVMTNPLHPELDPGFVYLKPPAAAGRPGQPAFERAILYAAHKDFGAGIPVGFLDGHVEFVNSKQRFDDLVAKTALDEAAP